MSAVDHAAEAMICVKSAHSGRSELAEFTMAQAQVHATLALVEQQRIANLIALGQYTIVPGEMPVFRAVIFDPAYPAGAELHPDVKKALGLS